VRPHDVEFRVMEPKAVTLSKAHELLDARVESLLKDVRYCVLDNIGTKDWPAPLPALLYCFATIDLLGALYDGNAISFGTISKRAKNYMMHAMKYPEEKAKLLQEIFRHKIVHLAQLQPMVKVDDRVITWRYDHDNRAKHLELREFDGQKNLYEFSVSIWSLAEDIAVSVTGEDGYYARLKQRESLRNNFEKAYAQIFNVEI
jgi:hypothetical protein